MSAEALLKVLKESVKTTLAGADQVDIAYSGGLDSSIIAGLAKEFASVSCIACSVPGSYDAENAETRAKEDDVPFRTISLGRNRLVELISTSSRILGSVNPVRIAYTIPLISVASESDAPVVLAGNGADELFGGYAKYLTAADPERMMAEDVSKMLREVEQLSLWAEENNRRLEFPYAASGVLSFSKDIPLDLKVDGQRRKIILRDVAKLLNLRSSDRPKKAAQYSSGVLTLMERCAREANLTVEKWIEMSIASTRRSSYQ